MKYLLFISIMLFVSEVAGQKALPQIGTTREKALRDVSQGISNERWFINNDSGNKLYSIIFRNTPIGLKHALEKYEELKSYYNADECFDNSTISNLAEKDDEIDLEMLSITIKAESSEIKKHCIINDSKAARFHLSSTTSIIVLSLILKK